MDYSLDSTWSELRDRMESDGYEGAAYMVRRERARRAETVRNWAWAFGLAVLALVITWNVLVGQKAALQEEVDSLRFQAERVACFEEAATDASLHQARFDC